MIGNIHHVNVKKDKLKMFMMVFMDHLNVKEEEAEDDALIG